MTERTCMVSGCARRIKARQMCEAHYQRWRKYGDPGTLPFIRDDLTVDFWANVQKPAGDEGCWFWRNTRTGYATIKGKDRGRRVLVHRRAYELTYGVELPDDLVLDHLCHNSDPECAGGLPCRHRSCVNPAHLEPVSHAENIRRGKGLAGLNAQKTHCIHGHPFSGPNLLIRTGRAGRPRRVCLACERQRNNRAASGLKRTD